MSSSIQHLILLGPPGSGKGTQAKLIASKNGFSHLSTGDLIREQITAKTPLGVEIKGIVESGGFPDDSVVVGLVKDFMRQATRGIVFDGFPRTLPQASIFIEMLSKSGIKDIIAVRIDVPDQTIIDRLSHRFMCSECGAIFSDDIPLLQAGVCDSCQGTSFIRRKDDTEGAVKKRLSIYSTQTEPMVKYLSEKLPFFVIDGTKKPESVTFDILQVLKT